MAALQPLIRLDEQDIRVADLNDVGTHPTPEAWKKARVNATDAVLISIARGDGGAPTIVDHPLLMLEVAGTVIYLEPDGLTFRVGLELELVEIKSFPVIDGQADPMKVTAMAGQSAVYLLALRQTLVRLGFDPNILRSSVVLVAPRNFGRRAVAHRVDLKGKVRSMQRVLERLEDADELLSTLPPGFTLDAAGSDAEELATRTADLLHAVPCTYVPECLSFCDLALYCRDEAISRDEPSRLGLDARDKLGGLATLSDALHLAKTGPSGCSPESAELAEYLHLAFGAITRARNNAPREKRSRRGRR